MSKIAFATALDVNAVTVSNWERDQIQPRFEQLDKMVKLIDVQLTMEQCLVLPFEAPEAERKYRAILGVIGGISQATPVPIVANSSSKTSEPVKFKQKPKARKVEPLRTKAQVANYGRKKRDGP